ncbi:MAG: hypothetical protein AAF604_10015 [Acidobacteriota bacterium]
MSMTTVPTDLKFPRQTEGSNLNNVDVPLEIDGEDFSQHMTDPSTGGVEDMVFYLQLQMRIMAEQRFFTTFSNIIKARHETAQNSVRNMRSG